MTKMLNLIAQKKLTEVIDYLIMEINKLYKAGADFAAMASNTPHIVFNELPLILTESSHNGIPLLDTSKLHVKRIVQTML